MIAAAIATTPAADRHPCVSVIQASSKRKIRLPVAKLAVSRPVTRPRRAWNQGVATMADSGIEMAPVAVPMTSPQITSSCQSDVMNTVRVAPPPTAASPAITHAAHPDALHERRRRTAPRSRRRSG
jgi:hypothetical protein